MRFRNPQALLHGEKSTWDVPAQNLVAETEEHDFRVNVMQLIRNQDPMLI